MISEITFNILRDYGELGIILGIAILVLLITLIVFQIVLYGRVASYRLMNKKQIRESEPAISVIIPLFAEDTNYLDTSLVTVLTQDHKEFEVVLVYVGNNSDFFEDVRSLQRLYPHLNPVHINCSPHYPVSPKMALNIGIKSAKYDFIITSSADATPSSGRWLSLLAKGFLYGDIVLGYCGVARQSGFKNFIFREYRLATSIEWISAAINNKAFAASRNAFGFSKELYFSVRGYNYLNMSVGEDDLFLQQIATPDNVSVVLSPRAACTERTWGGWRWWWHRIKLLRSTHQYYPKMTTTLPRLERTLRFIFFAVIIAAIVIMPWEFKLIAVALALVRYFFVLFVVTRNARRLGESGLAGRHIIYDFIEPVLRFFIALGAGRKEKQLWQ